MNYPGFNEALNRYRTFRSMRLVRQAYRVNRCSLSRTEATTQ